LISDFPVRILPGFHLRSVTAQGHAHHAATPERLPRTAFFPFQSQRRLRPKTLFIVEIVEDAFPVAGINMKQYRKGSIFLSIGNAAAMIPFEAFSLDRCCFFGY